MSLETHAGDGRLLAVADAAPRVRRFEMAAIVLVVAGFAVRAAVRLARGETDFMEHGYGFYVGIAQSWLAGAGLCAGAGDCAMRAPLYPLFIAPVVATGWLYPGISLIQAAIGAATVWLAWRLARLWFGERAGVLAAALAALSPYAVVHDTALGDTALVNCLVLLGVLLLVVGSRAGRSSLSALSGGAVAFALAMLTTARVVFLLPAAAVWITVIATGRPDAWRRIAAVCAPLALLVGCWVLRNALVVGAPVLTTETGISLWVANSPVLMEYFPRVSIDRVTVASTALLSTDQQAELAAARDEVARNRVFTRWGLAYMVERPWATARRMLRKVTVVAWAELSPARGPLVQAGYTAVYGTVQLLAAIGLWQTRRAWREHALVWLVLLGVLAVTAVFWAHTSHRSVVDAILFVYAAGVVSRATTAAHPSGPS